MFAGGQQTSRFFERVTAAPWLALGIALLAIGVTGFGLTKLVKDTSVKAFIPAGHEALLSDAKAADVFGLSDTIAVAVEGKPQVRSMRDDGVLQGREALGAGRIGHAAVRVELELLHRSEGPDDLSERLGIPIAIGA